MKQKPIKVNNIRKNSYGGLSGTRNYVIKNASKMTVQLFTAIGLHYNFFMGTKQLVKLSYLGLSLYA